MASESRNQSDDSAVPPEDRSHIQAPPPKFAVLKVYDSRGELTLHRLSSSSIFICGRYNKEKTAKLVAAHRNQWNDLHCNGRYGQLLLKK